jgi:hypothetical protein
MFGDENKVFNLNLALIFKILMENEKLKVLLNESHNFRGEIVEVVKSIHNCFFAFVTTLGVTAAVAVNLYKEGSENINVGYLAFLISQLEVLFIFYYILLVSGLATAASYVAYIENKINSIVKENLVFWEQSVSTLNWKKGSLGLSALVLNIFYGAIFITNCYLCFKYLKTFYHIYLWIQIAELIIIFILLFKLSSQYSMTSKYIRSQINNKKLRNSEN